MTKQTLIKKQLEKAGNIVYLQDGEWTSMPYSACVTHLWRKKSSAFEPEYTELGIVNDEYYLYIGPFNHNIKAIGDKAVLIMDDEKFEFKCKDAVCFDSQVIYYTGVLRKLVEVD